MYIFIGIIFISELIIAHFIISNLIKWDRKVRYYNACVESFNPLLQTCMQYGRCLVASFKNSFEKFIAYVKKKHEQLITKVVFAVAIYSVLILFRVKTKKVQKIYKLVGVIKDLVLELAV